MTLGNFSISLTVKDIVKSRDFYEKLGFSIFGGDQQQGWLIMKSGETNIGLFQGMFPANILTFNPGWNSNGENVGDFEDVRSIQQRLKDAGLSLDSEVDTGDSGPGSFMLTDPDGNQILFDQHR